MKFLLLALALTLVRGSTLKMVTDNVGNVTTQPSFGPFRDVQSVSEYEVHSTTPTITLLKELVNAYDDPADYEVKKLEIIATTNKVREVTTGQPTLATKRPKVSSTTTDVPVTTKTPVYRETPTTSTAPTTTRTSTTTTTPSTTVRTIPTRSADTTVPTTKPTTPIRVTVRAPTRTTTPKPKIVVQEPVNVEPRKVPVKGSFQQSCPRPEDIHPCECVEIRSHQNPDQVETVSFCKNIRNSEVLKDAMKGMQGHYINYFVVDSCKMPPFPNGLFQNVGIGWMEMLNSTIQFHENFFSCSSGCW